jgi:hypothetical protein
MKKFNSKREGVIILFILSFIGIGVYSFFTHQYKWTITPSQSKCPIEYGKLICIKDKPRIPFYNPNSFDLKDIQVTVPKEDGEDIYQVIDPLKAGDVQVLTLRYHNCSVTKVMKNLSVKWCCGSKCYGTSLTLPSDKITVKLNKSYHKTKIMRI